MHRNNKLLWKEKISYYEVKHLTTREFADWLVGIETQLLGKLALKIGSVDITVSLDTWQSMMHISIWEKEY